MSVTAKLQEIISDLEAVKEAAAKVDKGLVGKPGTAVRQATLKAEYGLKEIRGELSRLRNPQG